MINDTLKKRDASLDFLKVMATIAVVKLHAGYTGFFSEILHYLCGFAVPIFFMVSGALVLNSNRGEWNYIINRITRILFLMFLWNILFAILVMFRHKEFLNPIIYVLQALFQKGFLWHFWYLWALIGCYLLTPFLGKIYRKEGLKDYLTIILLLICTIFSSVSIYQGLIGEKVIESIIPQALRIWIHITYYWIGGVIYGNLKKYNYKKKKYVVILVFFFIFSVGIAVFQYCMCNVVVNLHSPEYCFSNPIIIVWNCIMFGIVCSWQKPNKWPNLLKSLMNESLGIYILHPFIILIIQMFGFWNEKNWTINFVVTILGSYIIAKIINQIPIIKKMISI